jgi:hypothetical protein
VGFTPDQQSPKGDLVFGGGEEFRKLAHMRVVSETRISGSFD